MLNLSDAVLKQYGDDGADTLCRYYAQIDYTALWCTRLLYANEGIQAIMPETVEDLVIVRNDRVDLHQVKTRDESQGPWKTAEVLPILCKMYHHRKAFSSAKHCFHFVSDARADTATQLGRGSYGALYRLKELLESARQGDLSTEEAKDFDQLQGVILPRVQDLMLKGHAEVVTEEVARDLLLSTWIDTNSQTLRMPDCVVALGMALAEAPFAAVEYTTPQIMDIHGRLILRIIGKIFEPSISDRRIVAQDLLECRTASNPLEAIDLDAVPGRWAWEKKAFLGGFDSTEMPAFNRLRLGAVATTRQLGAVGLGAELLQLTSVLVDQHTICRDEVCRSDNKSLCVGPEILRRFRSRLPEVISRFPSLRVTEPDCLGIAWEETDNCVLWWHALQPDGG